MGVSGGTKMSVPLLVVHLVCIPLLVMSPSPAVAKATGRRPVEDSKVALEGVLFDSKGLAEDVRCFRVQRQSIDPGLSNDHDTNANSKASITQFDNAPKLSGQTSTLLPGKGNSQYVIPDLKTFASMFEGYEKFEKRMRERKSRPAVSGPVANNQSKHPSEQTSQTDSGVDDHASKIQVPQVQMSPYSSIQPSQSNVHSPFERFIAPNLKYIRAKSNEMNASLSFPQTQSENSKQENGIISDLTTLPPVLGDMPAPRSHVVNPYATDAPYKIKSNYEHFSQNNPPTENAMNVVSENNSSISTLIPENTPLVENPYLKLPQLNSGNQGPIEIKHEHPQDNAKWRSSQNQNPPEYAKDIISRETEASQTENDPSLLDSDSDKNIFISFENNLSRISTKLHNKYSDKMINTGFNNSQTLRVVPPAEENTPSKDLETTVSPSQTLDTSSKTLENNQRLQFSDLQTFDKAVEPNSSVEPNATTKQPLSSPVTSNFNERAMELLEGQSFLQQFVEANRPDASLKITSVSEEPNSPIVESDSPNYTSFSNGEVVNAEEEKPLPPTRFARLSVDLPQANASQSLEKEATNKPSRQANLKNSSLSSTPLPADISTIRFIINSDVCQSNNKRQPSITALMLVSSHAANRAKRNTIRKAYPAEAMEALGIRRVFVVSTLDNVTATNPLYRSGTDKELFIESEFHSDIVKLDIIEAPNNVTYKNLMALKWAALYCSQASFIVKSDDDVIIDYYQMVNDLKSIKEEDKNSLIGKVWVHNYPSRDSSYMYYVSFEEYSQELYPQYVSGFVYVVSPETAKTLVLTAKTVPFLKIDDVYITGMIAEKAGIKHMDVGNKYTYHNTLNCCHSVNGEIVYNCGSIAGLNYLDVPGLLQKIRVHSQYCYESKKCKDLSEAGVTDDLICF